MRTLILIMLSLLFLSCNDDFTPNGPYTPKLIVYSVLDAANDTQYVRVYSSFSPAVYRPDSPSPNTEIANATVRIADDSTAYVFHDTLMTIGGKQVRLYVHPQFRPKDRKVYHLSVASADYPTATSTATGVESGQILMFDTKPLFEPAPGTNLLFDLFLGRNCSAYLSTLKLEYELFRNGAWVVQSREVPLDVVYDASGATVKRYYPIPVLYQNNGSVNRNVQIKYATELYTGEIKAVKDEYPTDVDNKTLRFKDVRLTLVQFDNEVFTYYSVANNYPGATTIRLDEPDYTNMKNGFGIFGAMVTQQKVYGIPAIFP